MPEICRFLGIVISMYHREHNPPHFHAQCGKYIISVEINTGDYIGYFPKKALKAVLQWHKLHKKELMEDWELASQRKILKKIKPLE